MRDSSSVRWRLAAIVGPEILALGLAIFVVLAVLLAVRSGTSDPDEASPSPSPAAIVRLVAYQDADPQIAV